MHSLDYYIPTYSFIRVLNNGHYDYSANAHKDGEKLICSLEEKNTKLAKALEELVEEEKMMKDLANTSWCILNLFTCNNRNTESDKWNLKYRTQTYAFLTVAFQNKALFTLILFL